MQKGINDIPRAPRFSLAKRTADQFLIDHKIARLPFKPVCALLDIGCRIRTYSKLADLNNTTIKDVIKVMGSKDGRTVLWGQNQYIVFINDRIETPDRIRWTLAHELSHIILHHLEDYNARQTWLATPEEIGVLDSEANACASELMSPACVLYSIGCCDRDTIHETCDISYEAAGIRQNLFDKIDIYKLNRTEQKLLPQFSEYMSDYGSAWVKKERACL